MIVLLWCHFKNGCSLCIGSVPLDSDVGIAKKCLCANLLNTPLTSQSPPFLSVSPPQTVKHPVSPSHYDPKMLYQSRHEFGSNINFLPNFRSS